MPTGLSSTSEGKKKRRIVIVSSIVILLSLISLVRSQCGQTATMDKGPFLAQGEIAAEETIKALGDKANVVILKMEMRGTLAETTELQLDSFLKTLKKGSSIKVSATETFHPPPYVDSDDVPLTVGVTGEFCLQVFQKHPQASAIVSFAGVPVLNRDQISALSVTSLRFIAAGNVPQSPPGALRRMLDANLILFAITPRTSPAPPGEPKTPREVFDKFYQIVTPPKEGGQDGSS